MGFIRLRDSSHISTSLHEPEGCFKIIAQNLKDEVVQPFNTLFC